jgi:hypothetical protein
MKPKIHDGGGRAPWGRQGLGDGLIAGQRAGCIKPALGCCHAAQVAGLAAAHDLGRRDVAVGVALTHAQQGLTSVVHLESPACHLLLLGAKGTQGRDGPLDPGRCSVTGYWLHYADPPLAPLRRSRSGSNMPITKWLQYGGR